MRGVMTVLGPIAADALGVTDAHEHLFVRSPALAGQELDSLEAAVSEVAEGMQSGLAVIVEMTPIGCGRRPDLLRAVAEATGATIIAASGYHRDEHYPPDHWVHHASIETLAERVIVDVEEGMHPRDWLDEGVTLDPARAGVIKAGVSYQHVTRSEARRLEAVAAASRSTGSPVLVHAEVGTCADEILDRLEAHGLAAERVILAHMDRNPDPELHIELCARGATLEYDTVGRTKYHPDSVVLDLIEAVVGAGHLERLLLGLDLGRRDYHRAHDGGPGLRYLMATFVPRLRRRLGDAGVEAILVGNARRAFSFAEPATERP